MPWRKKMRFENQVVVITGGSSGIGVVAAQTFTAEGAQVVITGRNARRTRSVVENHNLAHFGLGDITDPRYCSQFIDEVVDRLGRIDVLVNNAGMIIRADTVETADEQWFDIVAININAVFFMSREALCHMRRQQSGAIVNISSTCGLVGCKGLTAYCTTKGAVIQMTQAMALDCAADGIRVNAVCPGATDTPMLFSAHRKRPSRDEMDQVQAQTVPMQRMAAPDEVVSAILFLASAEASYITGSHLCVDGGYTAQ
jgi:NAD(P)-dependent dehydrogenase (short-subunit alcohol dehydrogenase family)